METAVRTLRVLIISSALAAPLVAPTTAVAGGWWSHIDLQRQYLVQGRTVETGTVFLFSSIEAAERARDTGGYFAYLIAGLDWDIVERAMSRPEPKHWWSIEGARPIRVGSVNLGGWDANMARATTRFVVPETLEPGRYALMLCDAGCRNPLGDIVPSSVRVVASSLEGELAHRVDELERQLRQRTHQIRRLREAVAEGADLEADVGSLRARVVVLEAQLDRASEPAPVPTAGEDASVPWWTLAGWFLAGVATIGLVAVVAWRRRPPDPAGEDHSSVNLDAELLALTRGEGGSARTGGRTGP
jgi:hypothetical protein